MRFWDPKKDKKKKAADGSYPFDFNPKGRGTKDATSPFDFGFRQTDGSYIGADQDGKDMTVVIHPSAKSFGAGHETWWNTTLFCARCGK